MKKTGKRIRSSFIILMLLLSWTAKGIRHLHGEDYGICPDHHVPLQFYYWISEPTCIAWGSAVVTCSICDYRDVVDVGPLGHDYQAKIVTEATCTEDGLRRFSCSRCSDAYDEKIEALGHSYYEKTVASPTCTKNGTIDHICERCGDSYTETVKALGHKYVAKLTKEATCTEDGIRTFTCSRCKDTYTETIPASGHDFSLEIKQATCQENGYKKGVCQNCQQNYLILLPKLKHEFGDFTIIKQASCTEEGMKEAICKNCGEQISEKIAKTPHEYPAEWTIEKKAGFFHKGLASKTCMNCGEKLIRETAEKDKTALYVGAVILLTAAGGLWYCLKKKKIGKKSREFKEPSFEDKTIVYAGKNERLIACLKDKHFLQVKVCDDEDLLECIEENEPDLIIIEIENKRRFNKLLKQKEKELAEQTLGLIGSMKFISRYQQEIAELKDDKGIIACLSEDCDESTLMSKMILPIMKAKLNSDESLANVGALADFIGIPYISAIIDAYVAGRDVKTIIEEGDIGVSESAAIINDIASVLGLDKTAEITGLVADLDSIKAAFDQEAGAYENKGAAQGAKDIADVISDIVDKKN